MTLAGDKINDGVLALEAQLVRLVDLCAKPFVRQVSHEHRTSLENILQLVGAVAECVHCSAVNVQVIACETLRKYALRAAEEVDQDETLHRDMIEQSGAVRALVDAMHENVTEYAAVDAVTTALKEFTANEKCCQDLIDGGGAETILSLVSRWIDNDVVVFTTIGMLWSLLENSETACDRVANKESLSVLARLAHRLVVEGYRQKDKELRNEVLIVISFVARIPDAHKLLADLGMLDLMLDVVTAAELNLASDVVKPFLLTTSVEDMDMKQLMLQILGVLAGADVFDRDAATRLLDATLGYLDSATCDSWGLKWSPEQLSRIQLQVAQLLGGLVPRFPVLFQERNGNRIVFDFFLDQTAIEAKRAVMALLLSFCHLDEVKDELGAELGAIEVLLDVFADESGDPMLRIDSLAVVSLLCQRSPGNQDIMAACSGVTTLVHLLRWNGSGGDPGRELGMLSGVADALWNAIDEHDTNLNAFVMLEGVDRLLSLVEAAPRLLRNQMLGMLAGVLEQDQDALSDFHEWRSMVTQHAAVQILIRLWDEEEKRLGVMDDEQGLLNNTTKPLTGHGTTLLDEETGTTMEDTTTGVAAETLKSPAEILEDLVNASLGPTVLSTVFDADMRGKIFTLISVVGFSRIDYLSVPQQIKLEKIKAYDAFLEGEMWSQVRVELEAEGIRPTTPDAELLDQYEASFQDRALDVQSTQRMKIKDKEEQDMLDEASYYKGLIEHKRREASRLEATAPPTKTKLALGSGADTTLLTGGKRVMRAHGASTTTANTAANTPRGGATAAEQQHASNGSIMEAAASAAAAALASAQAYGDEDELDESGELSVLAESGELSASGAPRAPYDFATRPAPLTSSRTGFGRRKKGKAGQEVIDLNASAAYLDEMLSSSQKVDLHL